MNEIDNYIIKLRNTYNKKYREILCKRDTFLQSIQEELNIRLDGDNIIADIPDLIDLEDDKNGKEK